MPRYLSTRQGVAHSRSRASVIVDGGPLRIRAHPLALVMIMTVAEVSSDVRGHRPLETRLTLAVALRALDLGFSGSPATMRNPNRTSGLSSAPRSRVQSQSLCCTSRDRKATTVSPRIGDELGRGVEAHGPAIQQSRDEGRVMVTTQPEGGIGEEGKARGVGFQKAIESYAAFQCSSCLMK